MKTLDDVISHALKLGINPRPYIDRIKKKEDLPRHQHTLTVDIIMLETFIKEDTYLP